MKVQSQILLKNILRAHWQKQCRGFCQKKTVFGAKNCLNNTIKDLWQLNVQTYFKMVLNLFLRDEANLQKQFLRISTQWKS
jgi:hypothetical protein